MNIKSIDDLRALDGCRRMLTELEWRELLDVTKHEELAAHLWSLGGLILEVVFYKAPPYPGVPAEHVCALRQDALIHFDHIRPRGGSDFDAAWRVLEPITHTERDRELLRFCGLPEPRLKSHYKY